jgi:hypothetical protein
MQRVRLAPGVRNGLWFNLAERWLRESEAVGSNPANPTMEDLADVVTAPRSKRDERKPSEFNSPVLRARKASELVRSAVGSGVRGHTLPGSSPGLSARWRMVPAVGQPDLKSGAGSLPRVRHLHPPPCSGSSVWLSGGFLICGPGFESQSEHISPGSSAEEPQPKLPRARSNRA